MDTAILIYKYKVFFITLLDVDMDLLYVCVFLFTSFDNILHKFFDTFLCTTS